MSYFLKRLNNNRSPLTFDFEKIRSWSSHLKLNTIRTMLSALSGLLLERVLFFASTLLIVRSVNVEEYGKYMFALGVVNILLAVSDGRFSQAFMPQMIEGEKGVEEAKQERALYLSFEAAFSLITIVVSLAILKSFENLGDSAWQVGLIALVSFRIVQRINHSIGIANKNHRMIFFNRVIFPSLLLLSLIALVNGRDESLAAADVFLIRVLSAATVLILFLNYFRENFSFDIPSLKERVRGLSYSRFAFAPVLIGFCAMSYTVVDRLYIEQYFGFSAVAYYGNAMMLSLPSTTIAAALIQMTHARYVLAIKEKNFSEADVLAQQYINGIKFLIIPTSIVIFYFSEDLVLYLFGNEYRPAIAIAEIWALSQPILLWPGLASKLVYLAHRPLMYLPWLLGGGVIFYCGSTISHQHNELIYIIFSQVTAMCFVAVYPVLVSRQLGSHRSFGSRVLALYVIFYFLCIGELYVRI